MADEPLYIRLDIGPELKSDTNIESLPEVIFWLEAFKTQILDVVFNGKLEQVLEESRPAEGA